MRSLVLAGAVLGACSGDRADATKQGAEEPCSEPSCGDEAGAAPPSPRLIVADTKPPGKQISQSLYPSNIHGLRLRRSIVVRALPSLGAEKLGTVAAHTIVEWQSALQSPGCASRWIQIRPRGWVCETYLEAVEHGPDASELPKLRPGERVPGVYGKVIGDEAQVVTISGTRVVSSAPIVGSSTIRRRGTILIDGEVYWKIGSKKAVAESFLKRHEPSSFEGLRLQDDVAPEMPIAFAFSHERPGDWIMVRDKPAGKRVRRLAPRSVVHLLGAQRDKEGKVIAYRVGEAEFIAAADLRRVEIQSPPPMTGERERWFDVDLDNQVLVAYEGREPVYATLISSGTRQNPTETGIFRIWIKFAETSMSGRMGADDAYSVATVPWTQFYENDFALHTAYWHDRFGQRRSHGCINLSPRDARFVYFWSDPQVPKGWSMANGTTAMPGSMVRVHSHRDKDPKFKGAALKVQQARLSLQK